MSPADASARIQRRYDSHEAPSPAPGAMTYMLSKEQYLQDANPHAVPHLMFYYDKSMLPAIWAAGGQTSPVIDGNAGDAHAWILTLFIPVRRWSDGTPALPAGSH